MPDIPAEPSLWSDRRWLTGSQYRTDANLAARQSIYIYQQPRHDIARLVIDLAGLTGHETIADIGCGNGAYLAELTRRNHPGATLGLDLSPGMLHAARTRLQPSGPPTAGPPTQPPAVAAQSPPTAAPPGPPPILADRRPAPALALAVADATALPLPDAVADVGMAVHMLYHVPEPEAAVRELRRITRPGGRALVILNGADHMTQLRDAMDDALPDVAATRERVTLDDGERLLAPHFSSITRHDFTAELVVPEPEPIAAYVRSCHLGHQVPDLDDLVASILNRLPTDPTGNVHITTHSGCLVCT